MGTITKYIYWNNNTPPNDKGEVNAIVHILEGYNQGTLADFQRMAKLLRETFPHITDDQIECGKVFQSDFVKGHTIIGWGGYIPKREYPGWTSIEGGMISYFW
ncbi:MAG: hypothetical protein KBD17_00475 [Candidatus Pacebacteria bacterium]|nr:hypothetical protein [Candidatus Paceibacterota bacterium]